LPSPVPAHEARKLVAACDTTTRRGRRDAAVLLVLLRLGLRAGEVARLELGDFDWRRGEVTIRGKAAATMCCRCRSKWVRRSPLTFEKDGRPAGAELCF
jgi:integrase